MIGQTISHYKILEKLGEGGMGIVYKAQDTKLKRTVALKFLPQHVSATEADKTRFMLEAQAAASLNHPNICTIYGVGEQDGQTFIAMELVEGVTLREKSKSIAGSMKVSHLPVDQAIDLGLQIADGLAAAHEKGMIHRDIKSDNLMVTPEGRVKIMDFGLAKLRGEMDLTRTGTTVGTIAYMSPEQIAGGEVDQRVDLWAYGVVLYEMLTGERPFKGEHEAAVMYEILNVEPKALQSFRVDVPEHIRMLVSQLLQKESAKRIASAAEVMALLKQKPASTRTMSEQKSIAVLYFENMSPEKESEYFCAGMTEDIITDLSKIRELRVVSRSDVVPFRNKELNTRQVGESLRVNYILEGSVRKAGNKIRITAQLIDVNSGFHVWADRFDRLVEDIFDLQNEVSQKIAGALKISLTDSEKESLAAKPTVDVKAYDFYMRGRELLHKRGRKNNELAIQMFEIAVKMDPKFGSAYSGLVEAFSYMYSWYDGDSKWLSKIIEMSQKALELDPTAIDAQFGIGMVNYHQKRYVEAKRAFESVIQQQSDYYDAYRWLGIMADLNKDYDAALRVYKTAASIKPYSEEPWMHISMTYGRMGNEEARREAHQKQRELSALKLSINPDDTITLSRIACVYAFDGEREKALAAAQRVLATDSTDGLAQYNCACVYATLGDHKAAHDCLRRAFGAGYKNVRDWVMSDPDLARLREDPEFKVLIGEYS